MSAVIEIEPARLTSSGQRYRVWHNSEVLLESVRDPLTNAARALIDKGVTGRLQMRRRGRPQIDAQGLIAVLATQTVSESQKSGPRFTKWVPFSGTVEEST